MVLPADEWAAVKEASGARGLTPSTVVCAGYAEVLAYWSGSRHFLLNHMISHRTSLPRRAADVIGNFAALYPLEVDWRHTEPFAERARRLQSQVLSDLAQLSWSGSRVLQAWNQYRGTPGRAACPYAIGSALFVGPVDRPLHSLLETPQVVLDCETWELRDGGLWVVWDVIEAMFPPGLVDAMLAGYRTLLTRLATGDRGWEDPAPDLLPAAERQRRTRLNRAGTPVPAQRLAGRLPALAARSPDHPAVITPTATLTYRELHRRSARLAARLRPASGTGVRPGDLVAVVLPKGWEQVVAVLGVLTAGAAYVPIDPEWPAARIRHLLGDTGARAVLTAPESVAGLATLVEVPVLAVDAVTDEPRPGAVAPPGGGSTASAPAPPAGDDRAGEDTAGEDTAYVIYTSGSTGRPKGVMLDHRGPLNTILDINRRFGIYSGDTIFGVSSLCFDLSVYDIFGAVAAGATLVLPSGAPDPAGWVRMVSELRVTVWNSVPALMQLFVEEAAAAGVRLPALRVVLLSGDWIPVGLPARIRAVAPEARVVSLGGATEASIWSICHPVDRPDPSWVSIPYGRPLANQSWHILDATGRDAPTWSAGQLYIGGRGVALGYLGDPERTATAFVPHPRTGERLYRTGDLGRYLPDGEIELLGRIDDQLKIQGWRVEPGEIEHALATHPGVRRAAVVARRSASGRQLAGFVTGAADLEPDSLRAFLAARLPGHLVPVTVTVLESLPLTANGKLDRRALAAREPAGERATREFQPPRTATEAALAGIYQEVLGNGPVGIHDDFFARGGESFAALRVASLVARRLGRPIAPGVLLEHRSVAGLAGWLGGPDGGWSPLVWLRPPGDRQPWFFVHPAGGGVLCYRQLAGLLDGPVGAFQAPGPAVGREPLARVEDLAAAYLPDLLAAQPRGPYRLGGWSSGAVIAFELAHRLERRGERVERLVVIDAPAPSTPRPVREEDVLRWFREDLDTGAGAAGPAPGPDRAELAAALAVFRGVVRACHDYHPPPVTADITLVRAAQGTVTEFADHPYGGSPDWGWKALTTGSVAAVTVPGTHHSLLAGPHVVAVSEAVTGRRRPDRLRPAAARRL
jgi:amino acid adenylation domain-containing protein